MRQTETVRYDKQARELAQRQRPGVLVRPCCRLSESQIRLVDSVSRGLLEDPGLLSYNKAAAEMFKRSGAKIEEVPACLRVRLSSGLIDEALATAPSRVVLGAREPENRLVLDAHEPRVRFGSGSETNVWLDVDFSEKSPVFVRRKGTIERLGRAAHLGENLEHLDFFIRCVNIRDEVVTGKNKDINKFLAGLNNATKHIQGGLTDLASLDDVIAMGEIIAGSKETFEQEPILSFITCVIKSPLQILDDTASKFIEISRRRVPVVISSCPMGGATGPFDEFGMVAQVNAEVLAGVVLSQLAAPGAPVLYGAVPVRTRLDNLNDMYGAPEFNHYNLDCVQMARYYGLPCYSTAAVADASVPGIQATVEKLMTLTSVPWAGAQYIHYAFGLLERTNVFCPEQAIMDNAHIGIVKHMLRDSNVREGTRNAVLTSVREVMATDHKTYMYHLPLPSREQVYTHYPLEDRDGGALYAAHRLYQQIMEMPRNQLPEEVQREITSKIPGILPQTLQ